MEYDLMIKGGRIYDGSGLPSYLGDVGVRAGKIAEVGRLQGKAQRVVDADGLAVSPGFIDFHTHLDAQLLWDPLATSSCWHGVTTVIPGNCALALAPCKPEDRETIMRSFVRVEAMPFSALQAGIKWEWTTFPEYVRRLDERLGVNVAPLMGHCALRLFVMGEDSCKRAATPGEIEQMKKLLREGLLAGAIGFSTNQNPVHMFDDGRPIPSRLATEDEILALAGVLGDLNCGSVQISQGSLGVSNDSEKSISFFDELAVRSGRPVIWQSIAHRWDQPDLWRRQLDRAENSLARGARSYPLCNARLFNNRLTLKNAQVFDDLPTWKQLMFMPFEQRKQLFRDPEVRAKLRFEAVEDKSRSRFSRRWDLVYFIKAARPENKDLEKKSVREIAELKGKDVIDAFLDLSLEEDLEAEFQTSSTNGDEKAVAEILRSPYTLVGQSDAGAHLIYDAGYGYATRLLGYWIRERNVMTLEEGIRKLTFMVASIFGLDDRGLVRPGMAADLAVFDPRTVCDSEPEMASDLPAGEKRLVQKAVGVKMTVVNGQVLTEDGKHTGAFPGHVLGNARVGL